MLSANSGKAVMGKDWESWEVVDAEWDRGGSVQVSCLTSTPFADQFCRLLKDQDM